MQLPFGSYRHTSPVVATARLMNVYAEQSVEKGPLALRRSPGIRHVAQHGKGPCRGLDVMAGVLFGVIGTDLVRIADNGAMTVIGTIPGTSRVSMANNGSQMVVTADGLGFLVTSNVVPMPDTDFRFAGQVGFVDQFILAVELNSGRFFHSDLANAASWDPLNFATAESSPDNLVGLVVDHQEIILAGETSTEIWFNAGTAGSPFARDSNGVVEMGCAAAESLAKLDNSVFWLANDNTVRRLSGVTPVRVSTYAIEQAIRSYGRVDTAYAYTYTLEGHLCYVLHFPSADATWVFDVTTGEWHERDMAVADMAVAYGQVWCGHSVDGRIGVLDAAVFTQWGDPMRCEWTYPSVYAEGVRAFHHQLTVGLEVGQGLVTGQGSEPLLLLYGSSDGGYEFTSLGQRSMGRRGERRQRVTFNRLGSARSRTYRCAITDPVPFAVYDTALVVDGGRL